MNEYNRICLCNKPYCQWCKVWNDEQAQKQDAKADAKKEVLRTKFKVKK
jgi:hypothetical protein